MARQKPLLRRLRMAAFLFLGSGALFSTCTSRLKVSAVDGATNYLFTLLDPATIASLLVPTDSDSTSGV